MRRAHPLALSGLITFVVAFSMCGPTGMPTLVIEGPSTASRDGVPINLRVIGSNPDGTVASGTVEIKSDVGSLRTPVRASFDEFGTARVSFACDAADDTDCTINRAIITATWKSTVSVSAELNVRLADRGSSGSGGGGAGGGTGGGPAACGGVIFNRQLCTGAVEPGPSVQCCRSAGSIPDCRNRVACPGQSYRIPYVALDGGSGVLPIDMVFTIPARPMNPSDCRQLEVGYRLAYADGGFLPQRIALHTFGTIEPTGKYFGIRYQAEYLMLRTILDEECLAISPDGGRSDGIWNLVTPPNINTPSGLFGPVMDAGAGTINTFFFRSLY
jgi:hypothetical protein